MSLYKKSNQPLQIITDLGRKIIKQMGWLIMFGILLKCLDEFHFKKICLSYQQPAWQCSFSPFIGNLGSDLFQVAITIWFVDIGLKRETLEEMHREFKSIQPNSHIQKFYSTQAEYNYLIENSFKEAKAGQEIKLLCLSVEEAIFLKKENLKEIRDNVINGCKIKILLLHPESSLLQCIERVGFTPNLHKNNLKALSVKLERLYQQFENEKNLKGTIEIHLHKDLFSPIGYYSDSRDMRVIWMYFSNFNDGNEYPAFQTSKRELIIDTEKHFDNLWQKTVNDETSLLLKITNNQQINNVGTIFYNT
ncbi:hypothetical protein CAL7716_001250 [Calothrix sp. PCC 7716]|nr:hypothetical protein CAL7716_001250 [Calothrix sp. PCC 7716]